jgi:hypothetical protein
MFGHQFADFCEDLVCALPVIHRKSMVYFDSSRDTGKECMIGSNEVDVQVDQNIQAMTYLICWDQIENKCDIHLFRVRSLISYYYRGLRGPISDEI